MRQEAPLGFLILIQFIGVVGDTLSQRCLRVVHNYSYRRFLTSVSIISALVVFICLSIFQIFYSDSARRVDKLFLVSQNTSSSNTIQNSSSSSYWKMINICSPEETSEANLINFNLTWIDRIALEEKKKSCFSQGPLTIWRILYACPVLILICFLNLPLYFSYPILLRDASGIVLFSIALTAAALLVQPLDQFEGENGGEEDGTTDLIGVKAISILLGIVGAVVCTFEKKIGIREQMSERRRRSEFANGSDNDENNNEDNPNLGVDAQEETDDTNNNNNRNVESRSELVEMMADEDVERMPINDEGYRRTSHDAPLTFWDFVDRAALDANEGRYRGDEDMNEPSYWFCCLCSDTCRCCRCTCCCCFKECWTPFWKAVVRCIGDTLSRFGKFILALPPFVSVISCISIWMALMRYVQDHCDVNALGAVTVDQVMLPIFILPMIFVWDFMSSIKHILLLVCCYCGHRRRLGRGSTISGGDEADDDDDYDVENVNVRNPYATSSRINALTRGHRIVELHGIDDREETFGQMFNHCFKELKSDYCSGLFQVILARIFVASKQLGYAILITQYDVRSFAEMSLAQILLSWVAMVFCVVVFPDFIRATPDEQRSIRYSWNVAAKVVGSLIVIASVFLMHSSSSTS